MAFLVRAPDSINGDGSAAAAAPARGAAMLDIDYFEMSEGTYLYICIYNVYVLDTYVYINYIYI